jgi:hypothetical protein
MTEDDAIDAMLKDAPGSVRFFVESSAEVIKKLSLLYAGTPDAKARLHLETYIRAIESGVIENIGAGRAPIILNVLRRAVMTRKHKIEAGGASRA